MSLYPLGCDCGACCTACGHDPDCPAAETANPCQACGAKAGEGCDPRCPTIN